MLRYLIAQRVGRDEYDCWAPVSAYKERLTWEGLCRMTQRECQDALSSTKRDPSLMLRVINPYPEQLPVINYHVKLSQPLEDMPRPSRATSRYLPIY